MIEPARDLTQRLLRDPDDAESWRRFRTLDAASKREVVEALKRSVDDLVRSRPPDAMRAAESLVRASRDVPELWPLALRGRATAAHFNGREERAEEDFLRAIEIYERAGQTLEAARTRRSLMDVYLISGRAKEALACAEQAREVLVAEGQVRLRAQLEVNVGNVYVRLNEYPQARHHYELGIQLFRGIEDQVGLAIAGFNLAVVEKNAGRLDEAERAFREARDVLEEQGMLVHVADCEYSLASLEARQGRYDAAIDGLQHARLLYERNGKPSGVPLCHLDLAEIYLRLDARHDALEHASVAAEMFEDQGLEDELARALTMAGIALERLGEQTEALVRWDEATALFRRIDNDVAVAWLDLQHGTLELNRGHPATALLWLTSACEQLRSHELVLLADVATVTLARAHLLRDGAEKCCELLSPLVDPARRPQASDHIVSAEALALYARARRHLGDAEGSERALRRAIEVTEATYVRVPNVDVRIAFFRDRHLAYEELAWDLAERGEHEEAFALLERSRSRSLSSDLAGGPTPFSPELQRARDRLDWLLARRLDGETIRAAGHGESQTPRPTAQQILDTQNEIARLSRQERRTTPAGQDNVDRAKLDTARGPGDVLVAYLTSGRGTRAFVADGGDIRSTPLDIHAHELRQLRDRLALHVDKLRLGPEYVERHGERLRATVEPLLSELGERLLAPVTAEGDGRPLVIIPYGDMHDLPFHAFNVRGRPLVSDRDVSYGLSTALVSRCRASTSSEAGDILATAAGDASIENVDEELETLRTLYGDRLRVIAPEELVDALADRPAANRVLHIASHGVHESRNPTFSSVRLGGRFLTGFDVSRRELGFQLVVLSGCQTALKRRIAGEEVFGLTRAFLQAGASAVLGSLWMVRDEDALAFMSSFYGELSRGARARAAVCATQRRLMEQDPHPFSWASFTLQGSPDVVLPHPSPRPR